MSESLGKAVLELHADGTMLDRGLKDAEGKGRRFGAKLAKVGKVAALGIAAIGAAAVVGVVKVMRDLGRIEKIGAQTEAVIESTGGAAKVSAKHVADMADSMEKLTSVEAESIQEGQNLLLTFTGIRNAVGKGNDIFDQATRTMTDMSVALGQDMRSSSIQLGKALNDPIRGVTALQRVGVSFTKGQRDQIKAMVESGNTMGAQKLILAELNKEFGGAAEALGKTLPGRIDILKARFGDLAEEVVSRLLPVFERVVGFVENEIVPRLADFRRAVSEKLQPVLAGFSAWIAENWPQIKAVALAVFGAVRDVIVNFAIPAFNRIREIATTAMSRIAAVIQENRPTIEAIWKNLKSLLADVASILAQTLVPALRFALTKVLPAAIRVALPVLRVVTAVFATLAAVIERVIRAAHAAADAIRAIPSFLGSASPDIGVAGKGVRPGPRAHGGPVSRGRVYLVGELGPELFVPRVSGEIVPHGRVPAIAGGGRNGDGFPDRITLDLGDSLIELVRRGKQRFEKLQGAGSW